MNDLRFDIEFPQQTNESNLQSILTNLDNLLIDCILYLAYTTAILSAFKFFIYIINGYASKSYLGSTSLDDTSFIR